MRGLDAVRVHERQRQLSVVDAERGFRMVGSGRLLVSCVRVPAQAEDSPHDRIRAGGRGGVQRSGSVSINTGYSMGYECDTGGPPFTLSLQNRPAANAVRCHLFFGALDATPFTLEHVTGWEQRATDRQARQRRAAGRTSDRRGVRLQQLRQERRRGDDQRPSRLREGVPVDVLHAEVNLERERSADLILEVFQ